MKFHTVNKTEVNKTVNSYKDVFQGIGKLDGGYMKDGATPSAYPARRIPSSLQDRLEAKLYCMKVKGIIEKISRPIDWVNLMVAVETRTVVSKYA